MTRERHLEILLKRAVNAIGRQLIDLSTTAKGQMPARSIQSQMIDLQIVASMIERAMSQLAVTHTHYGPDRIATEPPRLTEQD